jgi:hypothetical protein
MTFSVDVWKAQIQQKLQQAGNWVKQVKARQAPYVVYGFLSTMVLWPLLDALREALDTLLEKLEVIPQAYQGLNETDKQWFADALPQELAELGSLKRLEASLAGAGIIIQDSQLRGGKRSVVGSYGQHIVTGDHNRVAE